MKIPEIKAAGRKQSQMRDRSRPSSEERWKNSPVREPGGPLSLEERRTCKKNLQQYKGRVVFQRDNVKDEGRIQSRVHRARCFSVSDGSGNVLGHCFKGVAADSSDAVSTYAQVKMTGAPRLFRLPKEECPEMWIRIPPRQRPASWDKIDDPVVLLERHSNRHPLGEFGEVLLEKGMGKSSNMGNVFTWTS